ncbi:hypothetical protein A5904_06075 [Acidithiobacillus caldus]|uniref:Uncharacterized protein n=1 Tax=Acidithiobacillus caldus (strain SM-1) TaxID=990288 RepID=F9ZNT1_ACICS|nr:hypothetical protein [Acidithiobacillus caldus]AEK57911.1 hypothetical protein Atc_1262 [Acidithiobacillus caldus SM-1]AUW32576.1 hypothetical protein A5904_06075 [Acidithiobacillus caldus]
MRRRKAIPIEQRVIAREKALEAKTRLPESLHNAILTHSVRTHRMSWKKTRLLDEVLRKTYRKGDVWIFDSPVTLTAYRADCNDRSARKLIQRMVAEGLLTPANNGKSYGKPKEYIVAVVQGMVETMAA